jgi:hypothetical protein
MATTELHTKVFRELLIARLHFGPPQPPYLLGIESFAAPDYPPSTYVHEEGVRVVRRNQLLNPVQGLRRVDQGPDHEHGKGERQR